MLETGVFQGVALHPGTTTRAGKPFRCGSLLPFIVVAIITSPAIALSIGRLLWKSGVVGRTGPSAPSNQTSVASAFAPTLANTSLSRGPRQVAHPIAP